MSKKILKFSSEELGLDPIKPGKNHIPDWYKDTKGTNIKNIKFDETNKPLLNFKSCVPFFDSLSSGYFLTLHCDIHFELLDDGQHYIRWGSAEPIPIDIRNRDFSNISLPVPHGCSPQHYAWKNPYIIETPLGYSALLTHPLNRFDLPFFTLSAIIDSDGLLHSGFIPFFIKKDFSGTIAAGTPFCQIIPFKRDSWKSQEDKTIISKANLKNKQRHRKFIGYYKDNLWKRKDFS